MLFITLGQSHGGLVGVDGVEDPLIANLRLGDEGDLGPEVRNARHFLERGRRRSHEGGSGSESAPGCAGFGSISGSENKSRRVPLLLRSSRRLPMKKTEEREKKNWRKERSAVEHKVCHFCKSFKEAELLQKFGLFFRKKTL